MNYTEKQLKQALAKMLPETYLWYANPLFPSPLRVKAAGYEVRDTELLHLCHLVEKSLRKYSCEHSGEYSQRDNYVKELMKLNGIYNQNGWGWDDVCDADLFQAANSTWQQRVFALAKVKGIEMKEQK